MDEHPGDQIHATVGEQAQNVAVGKTITQVNVSITTSVVTKKATPATRADYLHWLIDRNRYLDLRGIGENPYQPQPELDKVYISLRAQAEERLGFVDKRLRPDELKLLEQEIIDLSSVKREDRRDEFYARLEIQNQLSSTSAPAVELDEAVERHDKLVILGDPGSGKTTLLRYLALKNALGLNEGQSTNVGDTQASRETGTGEQYSAAYFPLLVRIADYAESDIWRRQTLTQCLPDLFAHAECSAAGLAELLQQELAQGGCLVLLDGLDEIISADDRRGIVQQIEDFIRRHERGGVRGRNRFIVTSRIAGYRSAPLSGNDGKVLPLYVIQEMDDDQIKSFLEQWCPAVEDFWTPHLSQEARRAAAQHEIDGILDALAHNPGVRRLAANPLMLCMLASIHRNGSQLPKKRILLYKQATDLLSRTWRTMQRVPATALINERTLAERLSHLAYWIHGNKAAGLATQDEAYRQLATSYVKSKRIKDWDYDNPDPEVIVQFDTFLKAVREHTGLFVERAPGRYGFMHLTFQEYYAARFLVARLSECAKLIRQHLHEPRWEEPILLALGFVGLDFPDDAEDLIETAILAQGDEAARLGFTPSNYEELLGRDYLFALKCWGHDIPISSTVKKQLLERLVDEVLYRRGLAQYHAYHCALADHYSYIAHNADAMNRLEPYLLAGLGNDNVNVRGRTVSFIHDLTYKSQKILEQFLKLLSQDQNAGIRLHVIHAIGVLKYDRHEVVDALQRSLEDPDVSVRCIAADRLVELRQITRQVLDTLASGLRDKADSPYIFATARSLFNAGKVSSAAVEKLQSLLYDNDAMTRHLAALGLSELEIISPKITEVLLEALCGLDQTIQGLAAKELSKLVTHSPIVVDGVREALCKPDKNIRWYAIGVLYEAEYPVLPLVQLLLEALCDDSEKICVIAGGTLRKWAESSSEILDGLIGMLDDEHNAARYWSASVLLILNQTPPKVINVLPELVVHENATLRSVGMGKWPELTVNDRIKLITSLSNIVKGKDKDKRLYAALCLKQMRYNSLEIDEILRDALNDDNPMHRFYMALKLTGNENISDVQPVLVQAIKILIDTSSQLLTEATENSEDIERREAATKSINRYGEMTARRIGSYGEANAETLNILRKGLRYNDDNGKKRADVGVREACVEALVELGRRCPAQKSAIIQLLQQTVTNSAYDIVDSMGYSSRDYAYSALQMLVANQKVQSLEGWGRNLLEPFRWET